MPSRGPLTRSIAASPPGGTTVASPTMWSYRRNTPRRLLRFGLASMRSSAAPASASGGRASMSSPGGGAGGKPTRGGLGGAGREATQAAHRRPVGEQRAREPRDLVVAVDDRQVPVVRHIADHRGCQVPGVKDAFDLALATALDHDEHPLLRFGEHHVVRGHAALAPRNAGHVDARTGALDAAGALRDRGGEAGGTEVLDRDHGVCVRQVHAGFEEALLEEWVADLDRGPSLGARLVELERCERRAVDPIAASVGADEHEAVASALGPRAHQLVDADQADAHRVDQRVVRVTVLEVDLASHRRDADAVSVTADARHDAFEVTRRFGQRAEAERVEQGDRPGAHGDNVADDAAHPGGSALVGLDGRRVVVRLDLEHSGPALADADRARVLPRTLHHRRAGRGQPPEQRLRALVRAVLRPEHSEHAELDLVGRPLQLLEDDPVLVRGKRNLPELALEYGQN